MFGAFRDEGSDKGNATRTRSERKHIVARKEEIKANTSENPGEIVLQSSN